MFDYRTDKQRVIGLGSAKSGVHHWWSQRLSSVALLPLTILVIFPLDHALGSSWADVVATYSSPFHAIVMILFLAVGALHLQQGLQVVIEDYVHARPIRTALLLGNTMLCALLGLAGVFAVAKIAFAG